LVEQHKEWGEVEEETYVEHSYSFVNNS